MWLLFARIKGPILIKAVLLLISIRYSCMRTLSIRLRIVAGKVVVLVTLCVPFGLMFLSVLMWTPVSVLGCAVVILLTLILLVMSVTVRQDCRV